MKKTVLLVCSLLVVMASYVYAGSDPKAFMNEYLDVLDNYIVDLGKVQNVDEAIAVTEKYTPQFKAMAEKGQKIKEDNPELFEQFKGKQMPEGYEDIQARSEELAGKMFALFSNENLMKIAQDPKYQEANMKLVEAMASMK